MIQYKTIEQVQQAYLAKALATECPKTGHFIGGKLVSSSTSDKPFLSAYCCSEAITATVANKYIKDGKVQDEAPISVISGPADFIGGETNLFAFTTPSLGEQNLKPTSINKGLMTSTVTFPANHNFAVYSKPIIVSMYQSVFGGYYTKEQLPENDTAKCLERYSSEVKAERNARISDTDSLAQLTDITVQRSARSKRSALTDEERTELMTYRQALRDLPTVQGFPFVQFPAMPECIAFECEAKIEQRNKMEEMR